MHRPFKIKKIFCNGIYISLCLSIYSCNQIKYVKKNEEPFFIAHSFRHPHNIENHILSISEHAVDDRNVCYGQGGRFKWRLFNISTLCKPKSFEEKNKKNLVEFPS